MEEKETIQDKRHVVLLDISLFILNVLSPEKITSQYRGDDIVLEVPSAFVTMIRDAQAGNSLLQQFIRANLLAIRNNPVHQRSSEPEIQKLTRANDRELESIQNNILHTIVQEFAPLISGALKETIREGSSFGLSNYPIQRYEPLIPLSSDDLQKLRLAYLQELNISPHPLFDLYFLQIYHAQTIGLADENVLRRELVSIGRATYESIRKWRGGHTRRYESSYGSIRQEDINNNDDQFVRQNRNLLSQFVINYFRERWVPIVTATTSILVDVIITIPQPGGLGWGNVGLAVVGFYSADLIVRGITNPKRESPEQRLSYIFAGVILIVCVFMVYIIPKSVLSFVKTLTPPTITPTVVPQNIIQIESPQQAISSVEPTQQFTASPLELQVVETPDLLYTPFVSTAQLYSDIGYCMYVIQPGDTLQSVASRFQVAEDDLRALNKRVALNIFVVNQMIEVNAPCCRPAGVNGFSYTVQRGETLYSIARRYSTTVETVASINNLYNPRYIQTGQMLCIP